MELDSRNIAGRTCYVYLVCSRCHRAKWMRFLDPPLSKKQLVDTVWVFSCPVHGVVFEKALQVQERQVVRWDQEPIADSGS